MKTKIVLWFDSQDPKNHGWAVNVAIDEGHGYESDYSGPVDCEKDAPLQEVIDEALRGMRTIPTAARDATNYAQDPDGYVFVGDSE